MYQSRRFTKTFRFGEERTLEDAKMDPYLDRLKSVASRLQSWVLLTLPLPSVSLIRRLVSNFNLYFYKPNSNPIYHRRVSPCMSPLSISTHAAALPLPITTSRRAEELGTALNRTIAHSMRKIFKDDCSTSPVSYHYVNSTTTETCGQVLQFPDRHSRIWPPQHG